LLLSLPPPRSILFPYTTLFRSVLGVAAGAVMVSAFGEPIEGAEGMVLMRIVPALFVVALGGAALGWLTAALVQVIGVPVGVGERSEEHTSELQSRENLVCRLLL